MIPCIFPVRALFLSTPRTKSLALSLCLREMAGIGEGSSHSAGRGIVSVSTGLSALLQPKIEAKRKEIKLNYFKIY
jgi:hypothetical protein